jgi:hypothetical protein
MKIQVWKRTLTLGAVVALAACGDATGVDGPQIVSLNFRVTEAPAPMAALASAAPTRVVGVEGSNGVLTLTQILVVVNEVELKPADGSCDAVEVIDTSDDCPEFEAPPRFLDLPLDGTPVAAVTSAIPMGTYKELDFEIEDLEDDEEEADMAAAIEAVRLQILQQVPDWPRKASAMVVGTFTPNGGTAEEFRVFVDAEIEVEFELLPNLVIAEDGAANRSLTVDVRPDLWFMNPDGSVRDLREFDYEATQSLLELEVEMEDGFTEIEIDD